MAQQVVLVFSYDQTGTLTCRGKSRHLTFRVNQEERGKPITPPAMAGVPQGKLMGLWVWDARESECRPVMGRIGVATSPHPKGGRLLAGLSLQESLWNF